MRIIILYFVITILGNVTIAQNCDFNLRGQVFDRATFEPLDFATVSLLETTKGAVADSAGLFVIQGICAGEYHLRVEHLGCAPGKYFIDFRSDTFLTIYLDHHTELLREIVVSGKPDGYTDTYTQQVITSATIKEHAGETLSDIAELVSGVRSLRNGSGISKPVIHGLFGNRIAIVNNGLLQAGQQWGADHAPEIDPNSANLITVVKGSDAIEYGAQAIGGAVIIESGPIVRDPHLHGTIGYAFDFNGLGHTLYSRISKSHHKLDWRWTGTLNKEGDHTTPDYYLTNTGKFEGNTSLQLVYRPNEVTQHQLYYSLFTTSLGIFAGSHISNLTDLEQAIGKEKPFIKRDSFSYSIESPKQQVVHNLFKYSGKTFFRDGIHLEWLYGLQSNHRKEFDIRRGNRSHIPALDLQLWSHVAEAKYYNQHGRFKYKSGIQAKWTDNTNDFDTGILPLIPDYTEGLAAIFFHGKFPFGKFLFEGGSRYDFQFTNVYVITKTLPREIIKREHLDHDIAVSAGLLWNLSPRLETRFNSVIAKRSPEVNELYSDGLHQGIAGIEEGNWMLEAETSLKSIFTQSIIFPEAFHFELTAHTNFIQQYIYLKAEDELRLTIRGAFPVFTYRQDDAWIRGIDVSVISDFSHTIEWSSKFSFIKGNILENKIPLSLIPPFYFISAVSWSFHDYKIFKGTKLKIEGEYTARQNDWDESGELLAPPAANFLFAAGLETGLQLNDNIVHIGIYSDNILNVKYRNYLNRLRYFSDEQGRSIRINIRYEF